MRILRRLLLGARLLGAPAAPGAALFALGRGAHPRQIVTGAQFPFGSATTALAADPRGLIWFATDKGEISSISTSGTVGARG